MSQEVTVQAKGLYTNPNYLDVPEGALSVASNVVISRPGVVEPTRGLVALDTGSSGVPYSNSNIGYSKLHYWDRLGQTDRVIGVRLSGNTVNQIGWISGTNSDPLPGGCTFYARATVNLPGTNPQRKPYFLNTNSDLYFTEVSGVMRWAGDPTGTVPQYAGVFGGNIFSSSAYPPGTGSAVASDTQVAYRMVWWLEDESGILHEGPPSGRSTYINEAWQLGPGDMNVVNGWATCTLPEGVSLPAAQTLVTLGDDALAEPNVPPGDYLYTYKTANSFAIDLGNGLTFTNKNVIRIGYAARNTILRVQVPREVLSSSGYYFQLYRSPASVQADVEGSDEMGLIWESDFVVPFSATLIRKTTNPSYVQVFLPGNASSSFRAGDYIYLSSTIDPGGGNQIYPSGAWKILGDYDGQPAFSASVRSGTAAFVYQDDRASNIAETSVTSMLLPWIYSIDDTLNDGLAGALLYTNPSQEGITQQNDLPPAAHDISNFRNSVFLANTVGRHQVEFQLTNVVFNYDEGGADPVDGFSPGMKFAITGSTGWVLGYIPDIGGGNILYPQLSGAFPVIASSSYLNIFNISPAQEIDLTAQSIVATINSDPRNNYVDAFYVSNADDIPGRIVIRSRRPDLNDDGGFVLVTGRYTSVSDPTRISTYLPQIVTSSADVWPNGLYYSKDQELEAFPATSNYFRVGDNDKRILRILPLQNALVVIKEEGIWRVVGDDAANFRVETLDNTVQCIAPDTCVAMNNKIYALTQYGVVEITEQGVQVISTPIDDAVRDFIALVGRDGIYSASFAIADPEDRKYKLFVPNYATGQTQYADDGYYYDFYTTAWTKGVEYSGWKHGIVHGREQRLWMADLYGRLFAERKQKNITDFSYCLGETASLQWIEGASGQVGQQQYFHSGAYPGSSLLLPGSAFATPSRNQQAVGYIYDTTAYIISSSFSGSGYLYTVDNYLGTDASSSVLMLVNLATQVRWTAKVGGNPSGINQYREAGLAFRKGAGTDTSMRVRFASDISSSFTTVYPQLSSSYHLNSPNSANVTSSNGPFRLRVGVPRNQQRCSELNVDLYQTLAHNWFQLQEMSVTFEPISEKQGKK